MKRFMSGEHRLMGLVSRSVSRERRLPSLMKRFMSGEGRPMPLMNRLPRPTGAAWPASGSPKSP
jgi:hypothetical protein